MVEGMDVGMVECVFHKSVRGCGCDCWPRCGSLCWPSSVLMVWTSLMFDDVGVPAGRGLGCRVTCPRPLPGVTLPASPECLSPLYWGWLWGCRYVAYVWPLPVSMACASVVFEGVGVVAGRGVGRRVACSWPWLLSMVWAFRVFEVVVMFDGRGLGRCVGRRWCRWCGTSACSSVFEGVGGCAGRRLGRSGGRWWTSSACSRVLVGCWPSSGSSWSSGLEAGGRLLWCWSGLFGCSRLWAGLLAVV